jgi:hypothetical protein
MEVLEVGHRFHRSHSPARVVRDVVSGLVSGLVSDLVSGVVSPLAVDSAPIPAPTVVPVGLADPLGRRWKYWP